MSQAIISIFRRLLHKHTAKGVPFVESLTSRKRQMTVLLIILLSQTTFFSKLQADFQSQSPTRQFCTFRRSFRIFGLYALLLSGDK